MKTDNIIFFYPSKTIGGAEFLFARLANFLMQSLNKKVFYIDYQDGFIRNNEEFKNINFLDFDDEQKIDLNIEGTLITPISNIYRIKDFINFENLDIHLIFWTLHTYNLIHVMPDPKTLEQFSAKANRFILKNFCKNNYNVFKNLLKQCNQFNGIFHMDSTTYSYNKCIFEDALTAKYLPIACKTKTLYAKSGNVNNNEINIAVLGRLCQEKVMPLLNIAKYYDKFKTNKKKQLHIIGDGECRNLIKESNYKSINIIFKNTLLDNTLDEYLINNVDILFAMGTSLIEGAALKLPVVPIPYSYKKFDLDKFHFLFESPRNTLGTSLSEYKKIASYKLKDILELIYKQNKKSEIGTMCYEYFKQNHSLESIANELLIIIENNSLSVNKYNIIKDKIGILKENKNLIFKIIKKWSKHREK